MSVPLWQTAKETNDESYNYPYSPFLTPAWYLPKPRYAEFVSAKPG